MGNRAQLQGIPWHEEKMKRTCNDGSRYCIYNHKICSNSACRFHHKQCVGKGNCEWFEPKTGTPQLYAEKTYKIPKQKLIKQEKSKQEDFMTSTNDKLNTSKYPKTSEEKHAKFIENAELRVNDIIVKIEKLENLSDKNRYEYTTEEIEKMFTSIEDAVAIAKQSFLNKNRTRFKF